MKIVFLIGNGFDVNLGMKTRYVDFYSYYQTVESPNQTVRHLKNEISNDIEDWSDLELQLGKYMNNINSTIEFDSIFEDIVYSLMTYLTSEEESIDLSNIDHDSFLRDLSHPETHLLLSDKNELTEYKSKWEHSDWIVDIITFNYTRIIEKILDYQGAGQILSTHSNNPQKVVLRNIEHIHGYIDNRPVMGVNDKSQIANVALHDNTEITETLIKSQCNKIQKHTVDDICREKILCANLICIFGSSLGDTDKQWWELIGNVLQGDCRLIIFVRKQVIPSIFPQKIARIEREVKNNFLEKIELDEQLKETIKNKIYIGVNTDIFSLLKTI